MPASWRWAASRAGPWPGTRPATTSSGQVEGALLQGVAAHQIRQRQASPQFPAAEALRWRKAIEGMREDGSLARILKQYDYQAP